MLAGLPEGIHLTIRIHEILTNMKPNSDPLKGSASTLATKLRKAQRSSPNIKLAWEKNIPGGLE